LPTLGHYVQRAPKLELVTGRGSNMGMGIEPVLQRHANQLAGDFFLALKLTGSTDEEKVRAALTRIAGERAAKGVVVAAQPLTKQAAEKRAESGSMLNHAALGYTIMSVMMSILMMAGAFLYERQHGTWGWLLTSPTHRFSLMAGFILSFFVTGMFQFAVLVVGTRLLFQVHWGPLLPLFAGGAAGHRSPDSASVGHGRADRGSLAGRLLGRVGLAAHGAGHPGSRLLCRRPVPRPLRVTNAVPYTAKGYIGEPDAGVTAGLAVLGCGQEALLLATAAAAFRLNAPVIGAWNAVAIPAAVPAATSQFNRLARRPKSLPVTEAIEAPSSTTGPH